MNNHLNVLPKQAKFDLKCSKMFAAPAGELTTLPQTPNREGQTPPIINSWLCHCEKKILGIEVYTSLTQYHCYIYTLMYINSIQDLVIYNDTPHNRLYSRST